MFLSPPFLWAMLSIILMGSELFLPNLSVFFFGLGAAATALATALVPGLSDSVALQMVLWAAGSVSALVLLRKKCSTLFRGTLLMREREEDVGREAVVIERITPQKAGRVRYQGTSWEARSYTETFEAGDRVLIAEEEGLVFTVTAPLSGDLPEKSV